MKKLLKVYVRLLILIVSRIRRNEHRQHRQLVSACKKLLASEKVLESTERVKDAYVALRDEATALRDKILIAGDEFKYDFYLHHARGVIIRTSLVIKNIETNSVRSETHMLISLHSDDSDFVVDKELDARVKAFVKRVIEPMTPSATVELVSGYTRNLKPL